MVTLLSKIFIKNRKDTSAPSVRAALGILCGALGIVLNIILFAVKLLAGLISGAISISADALNNLTDAGSSLITLIGFRMSRQKPDKDHPFGHGRIEYVSGLIVSLLIILVGGELVKTSIAKIIEPVEISFSLLVAVILAASIAVKAYMAFYNFKIGKRIDSAAMRATATDSLSDCVATSVVLVCLIISRFSGVNIDAYCGLAVSAFIIFSGIRAVKETTDPLLGSSPSKELIDKITGIVYSYKGVMGIHDLIVHDYGPGRTMISLHAEVSENADLLMTHDMIDNIEKELRTTLGCDAVIHMDPIATDDEEVNATRERVAELIKGIDSRMSIHDFRMVKGHTHTNVIFDVVVPFDLRKSEQELRDSVESIVKTIDPSFFSVINIDKDYTGEH